MENLQLKNEKKEKIKLAFLTFIAIFIYAFALLYGAFNAYDDYKNDLIQENKQTENISNLEIEKKNAVVDDFIIYNNVGGGLLALTEDYSFVLNYSYELFVNEDADFSAISFYYTIVVVNNSTHDINIVQSGSFSYSLEDYYDGELPCLVYNDSFDLEITLEQYQSTENYSLLIDIYFEQSYIDYEDTIYESYSYNYVGSLFEIQNNYRPIFVNTIFQSFPFDWVNSYSAIVSDKSYDLGYYDGYKDGEETGYENGYIDGEIVGANGGYTNIAFRFIWTTITNATNAVLNVFDFEILPGIPLYAVIAIPIIIAVLFYVLKVIKK